MRSEQEGLCLASSSSGLHHRSVRVEVRNGALVLLAAWALPGAVPQPQLSLAFEPSQPVTGRLFMELLTPPAPRSADWLLVG
jgi:hypothetical protein